MSRIALLIVAAGSGTRAGGNVPKQYQKLGAISLLRRSIDAFANIPGIGLIQIVAGTEHEQQFLAAPKNCSLQMPPMELQFCQDENGRSNH